MAQPNLSRIMLALHSSETIPTDRAIRDSLRDARVLAGGRAEALKAASLFSGLASGANARSRSARERFFSVLVPPIGASRAMLGGCPKV